MKGSEMREGNNIKQTLGESYSDGRNNVDGNNIARSTMVQGNNLTINDTTVILELISIIKQLLAERDRYINLNLKEVQDEF